MNTHQFVEQYRPYLGPMVPVSDLNCPKCREELWNCECNAWRGEYEAWVDEMEGAR